MSPRPSTLLGLLLCLGQMIHTQEGNLPKPSLRAEPGPVIPRGRPVTFVCRGPAGAELFRLEKDERQTVSDQKSVPQDGSQGTEARFLIGAVSNVTAGRYSCLYNQGFRWSERSEPLQLQMTGKNVSTPPSGLQSYHEILIGVSVTFILLLFLLLLLLFLFKHRNKCSKSANFQLCTGALNLEAKTRALQKSSSSMADDQEQNRYASRRESQSEEDKKMNSQDTPSEDAQNVTYAQLSHLTLKGETTAAPSSPSDQPQVEPSVYASLSFH
ncbi:unnamed protein product [Pipistrellus nathusii]|uniref:Leukocyte-associated immunoglobulin-like receptor 1 n=1 Tax=Pipistrellus nathusii TaxID=59473 RepID=A0ABN9ZII7_PIPNA